MNLLMALPIIGVFFWLYPLARATHPLQAVARISLLCFGLSALNLLGQTLAEHLHSTQRLGQILYFSVYYMAWPMVVMAWAVQAWKPENWSIGTWGRILIGWMALFELIRRFGALAEYWDVLTWLLPIIWAAALISLYRQGMKDPMLFLIPLMLLALYKQQSPTLSALFEAVLITYISIKLVLPYSRQHKQLIHKASIISDG
jgi:hypothetical protein